MATKAQQKYWDSLKGKTVNLHTTFKKGIIPWNKGIKTGIKTRGSLGMKMSEEAKEKISESLKQQWIDGKRILSKEFTNKGNIHTQEVRKIMSKNRTAKAMGKDNPNWNGGNSKGYKTGYYSTEYKNWRQEVFKRDSFTCRECGNKGYLNAHHIKSFAHYPELRFDLNNGLTLCENCHSKTDNYKGRNKNKALALMEVTS